MFDILERNEICSNLKSKYGPGALQESEGLGAGELPAYAVILRLTFYLTVIKSVFWTNNKIFNRHLIVHVKIEANWL